MPAIYRSNHTRRKKRAVIRNSSQARTRCVLESSGQREEHRLMNNAILEIEPKPKTKQSRPEGPSSA
jgi:hypothetical protein